MMNCMCHGIKLAVIGALFVVNDQGWIWAQISAWLLLGIILIVVGVLKAAMPHGCPVHGKPAKMPAKKVK